MQDQTTMKQIIGLIYNKYLERDPDESGLNNYLDSGMSIGEIIDSISGSEEALEVRKNKNSIVLDESRESIIQNQKDEERILLRQVIKLLWHNQYGTIDRSQPVEIKYNSHLLHLRQDDMYILGEMESGAYEIFDIDFLEGKTVSLVDVGLNVGLSVIRFQDQLTKMNLRINSLTGVEPLTSNFTLASKNIEGLNIDNINLLRKCVSEEHGNSKLYFPNEFNANWGGVQSRISKNGSLIEECENISFYELLETHKFEEINILKIDIEGAEKDFFEIDRNVNLLERFDYLYIENHDWLIEGNPQYFTEIAEKILSAGFVQHIDTRNIVYNAEINRDKCYKRY